MMTKDDWMRAYEGLCQQINALHKEASDEITTRDSYIQALEVQLANCQCQLELALRRVADVIEISYKASKHLQEHAAALECEVTTLRRDYNSQLDECLVLTRANADLRSRIREFEMYERH